MPTAYIVFNAVMAACGLTAAIAAVASVRLPLERAQRRGIVMALIGAATGVYIGVTNSDLEFVIITPLISLAFGLALGGWWRDRRRPQLRRIEE